jgi:hypothetical protein
VDLGLISGCPTRTCGGNGRISQVPGELSVHAPYPTTTADPGAPAIVEAPRHRTLWHSGFCLPLLREDVGSATPTFEADSAQLAHSLCTLRSGRHRTPRNNSVPAVASLTGRDWFPAELQRKFQLGLASSFSKFPDAPPTRGPMVSTIVRAARCFTPRFLSADWTSARIAAMCGCAAPP